MYSVLVYFAATIAKEAYLLNNTLASLAMLPPIPNSTCNNDLQILPEIISCHVKMTGELVWSVCGGICNHGEV